MEEGRARLPPRRQRSTRAVESQGSWYDQQEDRICGRDETHAMGLCGRDETHAAGMGAQARDCIRVDGSQDCSSMFIWRRTLCTPVQQFHKAC